jgi:GGDEF domain-containing protein
MKLINDVHGHRVGDEALRAVAAENCVSARIGGDEFGVVLAPNCNALTGPRLRANLKFGIVARHELWPPDGNARPNLSHPRNVDNRSSSGS